MRISFSLACCLLSLTTYSSLYSSPRLADITYIQIYLLESFPDSRPKFPIMTIVYCQTICLFFYTPDTFSHYI